MASKPQSKNKIFIVDDHPIVRRGIIALVEAEADLIVCGEAEGAREAMEKIRQCSPDMAIVDISLKDGNGLDLVRNIASQFTGLPILVLSMYHESQYAERALRAGALGYLIKQEADEKIITAIRSVLQRKIYINDQLNTEILHHLLSHSANSDILSERELEVLQLMGEGLSTCHIADRLRLSCCTINAHKAHIKEKLNLHNATELLHYAITRLQSRDTAK